MREHFMYRNFFSRIAVLQEGKDPLPRFDLCGMRMPEGQLIKHQRTHRYDRNKQMQWRRRDVAIAIRCVEESFSLAGDMRRNALRVWMISSIWYGCWNGHTRSGQRSAGMSERCAEYVYG